jgi:hypothetical protein
MQQEGLNSVLLIQVQQYVFLFMWLSWRHEIINNVVLTLLAPSCSVFWDMMPCSLSKVSKRFEGT